jgi:hypothetical protein
MGDSTWHWVLAPPPREWSGYHEAFWKQIALWLSKWDVKGKREVRLDLSRFTLPVFAPLTLTGYAFDATGGFDATATMNVEVLRPDGEKEAVSLTRAFGEEFFTGRFTPRLPGEYAMALTGTRPNGEIIGTDASAFAATEEVRELTDTRARRDLLDTIARQTHGSVIRPTELRALLRKLASTAEPRPITIRDVKSMWDRDWIFWVLVLALGCDWAIRRWNRLP